MLSGLSADNAFQNGNLLARFYGESLVNVVRDLHGSHLEKTIMQLQKDGVRILKRACFMPETSLDEVLLLKHPSLAPVSRFR